MPATLTFDGASRGNPGPAAFGFVLQIGNETIEGADTIGRATNNEAEYAALRGGLTEASRREVSQVTIKGDSELIVKQIQGAYAVNAENLQPLHEEVVSLLESFDSWSIGHIRRGRNSRADELANGALDEQS